MDKKIKTLILNSISNWAHLFVGITIAFIMSPFIVHRLGDFKYGIWSLIMSLTGYFSVLDLGMNRAIVRYVSKYLALNDHKKLNEVYNSALILFALIGVIVLIITLMGSLYFPEIFDVGTEVLTARKVLIVVGLDFALGFPFSVLYAVLSGKQKHTVSNAINISISVIRNIFIYVALSFSTSLLLMAIIQIIGSLLKYGLVFTYIHREAPEFKINYKLTSKRTIKKLYGYSIYAFVMSLSSKIINYTDEIIIGALLSVSHITSYAIAINLTNYFERLIWSVAGTFVPFVSELEANKDYEKIKKTYILGTKYVLLLSLPLTYLCLELGESFINLWMGSKYGSSVATILSILVLGKLALLSQNMAVAILLGLSKHKVFAYMNAFEAVANLILSILLGRKYGLIGVAVGTLVPSVIINLFVSPYYTCKVLNVRLMALLRVSALVPFFNIVLLGLIHHYFISFKLDNYLSLFYSAISYLGMYAALSYLNCLNDKEKLAAKGGFYSMTKRWRAA